MYIWRKSVTAESQMTKDVLCYHIKTVVFCRLCRAPKIGTSQTPLAQLSFGVSVQLFTWMSFLSWRDTQLSQLRLVVISPTISHVSVSSQYLSIVSWYLKQMAKL